MNISKKAERFSGNFFPVSSSVCNCQPVGYTSQGQRIYGDFYRVLHLAFGERYSEHKLLANFVFYSYCVYSVCGTTWHYGADTLARAGCGSTWQHRTVHDFPKKKKRIWKHANINVGGSSTGEYNGERVECENSFGESIKYINSENFCYANLDNSFGSLTVYFDNAMIPSGKATVNVDNSFGEVSLYVPKIWKVQVRMDHSFGSVEEKGRCEGSSDISLDIVGDTDFGTVNVYYI